MTKTEYRRLEKHTRSLYLHRQKDRKAKIKIKTSVFVLSPIALLSKWQKIKKKEGRGI